MAQKYLHVYYDNAQFSFYKFKVAVSILVSVHRHKHSEDYVCRSTCDTVCVSCVCVFVSIDIDNHRAFEHKEHMP